MVKGVTVRPCEHCGKELVWGLVAWPLETTPRPPDLCERRAFVLQRVRHGVIHVIDIRDLPEPPEEAYPQHVCRVWQREQQQERADRDRPKQVLRRMGL